MSHPVLLVEDDDEVRNGMREVLYSQGFDVAGARDGLEALRILGRGFRPCVILLDLVLPHLDGFLFREYQHANAPWADIPIIVFSGMDDLPSRIRDLKPAPAAWFKKPVDLDALRLAIAQHCQATTT